MDEFDDTPQPYSFYLSQFFWGTFKAAANIGKYFFGPFGGGTAALFDIQEIYQLATTQYVHRRTSKIISAFLSFSANVLFTVGSLLALFNPITFVIVACSAALPALIQTSYAINRDHYNTTKYAKNPTLIDNANEEKFHAKCATIYKTFKLIGTVLLFAGLFFPPLIIPGIAILGTATILDHVEQKNNYRFAKSIRQLFTTTIEKKEPASPRNNETELMPIISPKKPTHTRVKKQLNQTKKPAIKRHSRYSLQSPSMDIDNIRMLVKERIHSRDTLRRSSLVEETEHAESTATLSPAEVYEPMGFAKKTKEQFHTLFKESNHNATQEISVLRKPIKPASRIVP